MGRDILVDGYNIIKNGAAFKNVEARNFAAARDALVTQLVNRYRHTPHRVLLVFDGDSASEQVTHDRRICIIYSRHGETADSVIARLAAEARAAGREIEMYSSQEPIPYKGMGLGNGYPDASPDYRAESTAAAQAATRTFSRHPNENRF